MNTIYELAQAAREALPYLREEGAKYDDDGSNEPLELARRIEDLVAAIPDVDSDTSIVPPRTVDVITRTQGSFIPFTPLPKQYEGLRLALIPVPKDDNAIEQPPAPDSEG